MNVVSVFGWIIGIIVVFFLLLFIVFKVVNRNPNMGFQDFFIEKFFGGPTPTPPPSIPAVVVVPSQVVSDPLASMSTPVVSSPKVSDPLSEKASVASLPVDNAGVPDWLKSATESATVEPVVSDAPLVDPIIQTPVDTPLSEISDGEQRNDIAEVAPATPEDIFAQDEAVFAPKAEENAGDIPDWLKNTLPSVSDEKAADIAPPGEEEIPKPSVQENTSFSAKANTPPKNTPPKAKYVSKPTTPPPVIEARSDIPDWLRDLAPTSTPKETPEGISPDTLPKTPKKESTKTPVDTESQKSKDTPTPASPSTLSTSDLPDWLK